MILKKKTQNVVFLAAALPTLRCKTSVELIFHSYKRRSILRQLIILFQFKGNNVYTLFQKILNVIIHIYFVAAGVCVVPYLISRGDFLWGKVYYFHLVSKL